MGGNMPLRSLLRRLAMAALLGAGLTGGAGAHAPSDPDAIGRISVLSAGSALVFHGRVTNVGYRVSAASPGVPGMPFTFVTYAITEVLQGVSPGPSITLRFIGGTDGRGGFVEAEGVPRFQPGDEDVLFVAGNGESGCALVMCEFGRYRVVDGAVYEAHGVPIAGVVAGRIANGTGQGPAALDAFRFPAPGFDDIIRNPTVAEAISRSGMTLQQARAVYQAQAPQFVEIGVRRSGEDAARSAARGMALDAFKAALNREIAAELARGAPRSFGVLRGANAEGALTAPFAAAAAPPPAPRITGPTVEPGPIIRKD